MTKSIKLKRLFAIIKYLLIITIFIILFVNPKVNMNSFYNGLKLWATLVLPALFPILFVISILNSTGISIAVGAKLSKMTKLLFNCGGASGYIYILSILSGYPVGAKVTSELYENKIISHGEACRITAFASTSGPLFILGTVGVGLFGSMRTGIIILVSHMLGALINGIIFRQLYNSSRYNTTSTLSVNPSGSVLENCMLSSIKSILIIGGYIAISYMLISIAEAYNIFSGLAGVVSSTTGLNGEIVEGILEGLIEMTKGVQNISMLGLSQNANALLGTGLITIGGLSIFLQAYTYLAKFKIKIRLYLLQKILHTALSIAICSILILTF